MNAIRRFFIAVAVLTRRHPILAAAAITLELAVVVTLRLTGVGR